MILTKDESKFIDQSFYEKSSIDPNNKNETAPSVNKNISLEKYVELKSELAQVIINYLLSSLWHYIFFKTSYGCPLLFYKFVKS